MNKKDLAKTKEELYSEISDLRQQVATLQKREAINQRRKAEVRLSETIFQDLFYQSPCALQIYSPDGTIQQMNRSSEELWRVTYDQVGQYNIFQDVQLKEQGLTDYFARAFAGETVFIPYAAYNPAISLSSQQGQLCYVEAFVYPIKDLSGQIRQVIVMHRDITERKLSEDAFQQVRAELEIHLAKRNTELAQANQILKQQLEELKHADEQREILQQILETIPIMISYSDDQAEVLFTNREWEQTLGWSLAELQNEGRKLFLQTSFPDPNYRKQVLRRQAQIPYQWQDIEMILKDGRKLDTAWITVPFANGKSIHIGQDVTARKRDIRALKESEERFRLLAEQAHDIVYHYQIYPTPKIDYISPAVTDITGFTPEDYYNDPTILIRRTVEEDRPLLKAIIKYPSMLSQPIVLRCYRKDKKVIWLEQHTRLIYDKDGRLVALEGIARNVTERQIAEAALAAEKEMLAVTLRSIGDGVIATDIKGHIILINHTAETLLGVTEEEVVQLRLDKVLHIVSEKTHKRCRNLINQVLKTGKRIERANNAVLIQRHGQQRIISESAAPIRDRYNNIIGAVVVLRDITEKLKMEEKLLREQAARAIAKLAEEQLEKSNSQLQALSAHFLKMQEEERLRLARELHDEFGQALTSIKLALELAVASLSTTEINRLQKLLLDLCNYIEHTAKDVQRVARDLRPSVLDDFGLAAALESYVDAYSKRTNIKINLSIDQPLSPITKEAETALYRIVQEALTNVAKHARAKNIFIDLIEQHASIVLTVSDDGQGCQLDWQAYTSQPPGFGLLGMAERARMVGAKLSMRSKPGGGFYLQVILPLDRKNRHRHEKNASTLSR